MPDAMYVSAPGSSMHALEYQRTPSLSSSETMPGSGVFKDEDEHEDLKDAMKLLWAERENFDLKVKLLNVEEDYCKLKEKFLEVEAARNTGKSMT